MATGTPPVLCHTSLAYDPWPMVLAILSGIQQHTCALLYTIVLLWLLWQQDTPIAILLWPTAVYAGLLL